MRIDKYQSNRFNNYVIVIFGGTSGIGLMTTIDFISNGAKHVIIASQSEWKWIRAKQKLKNIFPNYSNITPNEIQIFDSTLEYMKCDIRLENNVKNTLKQVINKYKYVNVIYNNAGVQPISGNSDGDDITKLDIESYQMNDGSIIYRIPASSVNSPDEKCSTRATDFCENPIATSIIGTFFCLKWEMYHAFQQSINVPVSL